MTASRLSRKASQTDWHHRTIAASRASPSRSPCVDDARHPAFAAVKRVLYAVGAGSFGPAASARSSPGLTKRSCSQAYCRSWSCL